MNTAAKIGLAFAGSVLFLAGFFTGNALFFKALVVIVAIAILVLAVMSYLNSPRTKKVWSDNREVWRFLVAKFGPRTKNFIAREAPLYAEDARNIGRGIGGAASATKGWIQRNGPGIIKWFKDLFSAIFREIALVWGKLNDTGKVSVVGLVLLVVGSRFDNQLGLSMVGIGEILLVGMLFQLIENNLGRMVILGIALFAFAYQGKNILGEGLAIGLAGLGVGLVVFVVLKLGYDWFHPESAEAKKAKAEKKKAEAEEKKREKELERETRLAEIGVSRAEVELAITESGVKKDKEMVNFLTELRKLGERGDISPEEIKAAFRKKFPTQGKKRGQQK